ncbi:MAG: hypothetical protein RL189_2036 [Pseudomonadota bacterium]|jgi:glycosyltransferase involved in cell wall biosynthesis
MRIFMFVSNFLPHLGGLEFYVHDISSALAKNWGDETHVFCFDDFEKSYEINHNYIVHRIKRLTTVGGVFSIPDPFSLLRTLNLVLKKSGRPNQVWTHTRFFISSLVGVVFAKLLGIRTLHIEHGSTHVVHASQAISNIAKLWDHTLGRVVLSCANVVVVVSPLAKQFVEKLGAKRVFFVPAGATEQFLNPEKAIFKLPKSPKLLFVGRLLPGKGVENLIRSLQDQRLVHVSLDIIGDGPQKNFLENLSAQLGLEGRVRFRGSISREELPGWYENASIFVNPSFSEGGPLTVLEALGMGVPVVSTPVGCVEYYFSAPERHGVLTRGFSVEDLANALDRAIKDFSFQERKSCSISIRDAFSWVEVAGTIRSLGEGGVK